MLLHESCVTVMIHTKISFSSEGVGETFHLHVFTKLFVVVLHSSDGLTKWKWNSILSLLQWLYNSARNNARIDSSQHTKGNQNRILFHMDGSIV